MGIIEEGRTAIAEVQEKTRRALYEGRDQAVNEILGELSGVLAEPEFTGDVETALVHYMGVEAFEDEVATERYTDLVERIKDPDGEQLPVLFVYYDYDERGDALNAHTSLLKVDPDKINFRSARTREENVKMHVFGSETAGVTHRRLSIVAPTITFFGNVLMAGSTLQGPLKTESEFLLSDSHVADGGRGGGMPSEYGFHDSGIDRFYGTPDVIIGWEEIERVFIDRLRSNPNSLQEAMKIKDFFDATGDLDRIKYEAPKIATVIGALTNYQNAIHSLDFDR